MHVATGGVGNGALVGTGAVEGGTDGADSAIDGAAETDPLAPTDATDSGLASWGAVRRHPRRTRRSRSHARCMRERLTPERGSVKVAPAITMPEEARRSRATPRLPPASGA